MNDPFCDGSSECYHDIDETHVKWLWVSLGGNGGSVEWRDFHVAEREGLSSIRTLSSLRYTVQGAIIIAARNVA